MYPPFLFSSVDFMTVKTSSVKQLGWRGFYRLVTNLPSFAKLFSRLIKDERVALGPKLLVAALLAYVILPTDLVPDFLVGLGQVDDLIVLLTGLRLFLRFCPADVVKEHVRAIAGGR
jgi:uncharacterized membrane protein YkvA (DUF1232 family)